MTYSWTTNPHECSDLVDFITHSNAIEGIDRVIGEKEFRAYATFLALREILVDDLCLLVSVITPGAQLRDKPGLNVRVGNHIPPPGGPEIVEELRLLLDEAFTRVSAYKVHVAYETLHPFTDGNGRSGRALWLWMRYGNLSRPFLHQWYYDSLSQGRPAKGA